MDWNTRQPYGLASSTANRNSRFYNAEKPQRERTAKLNHSNVAPVSSTPRGQQPHYRSLGNVLDITDESMLDSDSITGAFCDDEADEFDPVFRAHTARLNGAGDYANDDMAYTRSLPRVKNRDKYRDCCATPRLVRRNDNNRKPMMFSDDSSDMSSSITDEIDDALTLQKSRQTKLHSTAPTILSPGRRYAKKQNASNVSGTSSSNATQRSTPSSYSRLGSQSPSVTRMARSQSPSTIGSVRSASPSILKSVRSPSPPILKTARSPSPSILKTATTQSPTKLTGRQFRETARESTQLPAMTRTSYSSMFRGQQQTGTPSSKVVSSGDTRSRAQLRDKSGDRSLDSDLYRSREKSRDRIQASTSSSRARTREKSEERILESSRNRSRDKSVDRMLDRARTWEKSGDRTWDSSTARYREKSADRVLTSSMVKAGEESAERMLTGTTARARGKSSDRILPSNAVRARGKSGDRIVDDSRVRARAKSGGVVVDRGNKPIESGRNGARILSGGDRAREREKSWDRLLDNSRTRGRDKSGNRMLGGDRAKSRERLENTNSNSRRTRTESGRWLDDESTWDVGSQLSPISPISHAVLPQPFSSKARAVAKVTAPSSVDDNSSRSRQSSEQQLSDDENHESDQEDASELVNVNETKSYSYCEVMLHDDNDASSKAGRRRQWSTSGAALSGLKYKHNSKSTPSLYTSIDERDDAVTSPVNLSPSLHDSRSPQSQPNHSTNQSHDYESPSHDYRSPSRDYGSCDTLSSPQDVRSLSRNSGERSQNTTNTALRRTPLSRSFRQQWQYKHATAVVDRGKKPSPSSFEKLGQSLCKSLSPSAIFNSLDNNSEENRNKTSTPKRTAITSPRPGIGSEASVANKVNVRNPDNAHRNNTEQSRTRATVVSPRTNIVQKVDQLASDSKGSHSWRTPREPHDTGSSSEDQIAKALPVDDAAHGNAMPDIMSKGAILGRNRDKSENWILREDGQPKEGGRSKSKLPSKPHVVVDRVTTNPLIDIDRPFSPFTPSQKRSSQSSCDDNNNAASADNQKDVPVSPLGIVLFGSKTLFGSKAMIRGLPPPNDASSESEEEAAGEQQQVAPRVDHHDRHKPTTPPSGQSLQQQIGDIKKSGASTYYPRRRTIDVILAEADDNAASSKLSPRARLYKDTTVTSHGKTHGNERRGETGSNASREARLYTRRETLAKSSEDLESSDSSGRYSSPHSSGILKHSYVKPKTFEAHNGSGPSWLDTHNRGQLRKTFAKSCEQLDTSPNSWDRNGNANESNFARSRSVRELQQRNRANSKSNLSASVNQSSAQSYVNSLPRRKSTTPPNSGGSLSSGRFRRLTEGGDYYGLSQENLADEAVFTDRNWSDKENGGSKPCNGEGSGEPEFLMYL